MHGREDVFGDVGIEPLPAHLRHAKITPEQALRGGRAQENKNVRLVAITHNN